jgi:hypothetical protein
MMRARLLALLAAACIALTACGGASGAEGGGVRPARVERVAGSVTRRVVLTEEAAKRIDVRLAPVAAGAAATATQIPYSAVLYDPSGATWAFVSTRPLTFQRQAITIDRIDADTAYLSSGPPAGTQVVTVGVTELYGAEIGVGDDE